MTSTDRNSTEEKPAAASGLGRYLTWRACCAAMVLVAIVSFTPIVIPPGQHEPTLAGLPRTLWTGLLVSVTIILLVLVGAYVHPDRDHDESDPS